MARSGAIVVVGLAILVFVESVSVTRVIDFVTFWAAGNQVWASHPLQAYNIDTLTSVGASLRPARDVLPFVYPPPFLLFVTPFAVTSWWVALPMWGLVTAAFTLVFYRELSGGMTWPAIAFPPVFNNLVIGQTGFLTGGFFLGGLHFLERRPWLAGALFGLLIIKPQLAVMLPVAMVAGRRWPVIGGALLSVTGILVLSVLCFGTQSFSLFLANAPAYASHVAQSNIATYKFASVFAMLKSLGAGTSLALAGQALVAIGAAAVVAATWAGRVHFRHRAAVLLAATALGTPYLLPYDSLFLALPLVWLSGRMPAWLAVLLWTMPLVGISQWFGLIEGVNLAPLLPLAILILAGRLSDTEKGRAAPGGSAALSVA